MDEINGITLKRYAELISKTANTATTEEFWQAIEAQGISRDEWPPIKDGWNARIFAPENYLTLTQDYNNFLEKAIEENNNGNPPCSLETFADINAQMYYRKDPGNPEQVMGYEAIMKANNIAPLKWTEYSGYWAPKTNRDEYASEYYGLFNKYSEFYRKN